MTVVRAAYDGGCFLTYDSDDVEHIAIDMPGEHIDHVASAARLPVRRTGQPYLTLRVQFKDGARGAAWVPQADAVLPDLRSSGEFLRAALDAEGVPAELASRIWNRFFFGEPQGLAGRGFSPDAQARIESLEDATIHLDGTVFPAGQTASERFAAMLKAARFGAGGRR